LYINYFSANPSGKISYSIFDLYGRIILENKISKPEYIDISGIADGAYFIRIVDGIQISTNKFIKVN